jgi:hypothetical protein
MPGRKKSSEQIAERRIAQRLLETAAAQYLGDLLGPKDIRTYLAENRIWPKLWPALQLSSCLRRYLTIRSPIKGEPSPSEHTVSIRLS